jgi:hypothetical protein
VSPPIVFAADVSIAAVLPLLLVAAGFVIYCVVDIARAPSVKHLPKWAWVLICLLFVPLGGIVYLLVGRSDRS